MNALLLCVALLSSAPEATDLVGLWESGETSKGGIGPTLEFRADGTFVEGTVVIVDAYYRLVGDRLVIGGQPPGAEPDTAKAPRIRLEGDRMIQTGPDGAEVHKERVGKPVEGQPAIVGTWRYKHYSGAIAFERFTDEGRMHFRLPMVSSVGRYVSKADGLVLSQPNRPKVKVTARLHGDTLSLSGSDGRTTEYRRVEAGAWYDTAQAKR